LPFNLHNTYRPRPKFPHSIKTKKGLRKLYNSKVVNVQRFKRPLKGFLGYLGIKHSGVVVTTQSGKKYLIHKGKDYGISSQTVVVDAKHMSKKWKPASKVLPVKKGTNIGKFVKVGGKYYNVFCNNCHHASNRMKNLG
ncbi:uncharacterized protein LOC114574292, partial [Exaiptasia diaphana]|uniref:Uncharacterized protein n=1 Tax=Exaiptasia diaphana TaxID=2652724 RepID=A0A913YHI2_EXADI